MKLPISQHKWSTANGDTLFKRQLIWMLLLRTVLYTALVAITNIFRAAYFDIILISPDLFVLLLLVIYLTTIVSAYLLTSFQGNLRLFGFTQILIDTFFVSILVFVSGSSTSIFTSIFFFPIVTGGLLLPRLGGLTAATAATIWYGAILFFETYGLYPSYLLKYLKITPTNSMMLVNHFGIYCLTFFLTALLSTLFGMRLRRTETALSDSRQDYDRLSLVYKQIFDNISTGILTIDGKNCITSANNAIKKITGYPPLSLVGEKLVVAFPCLKLAQENIQQTMVVRQDQSEIHIGYTHMTIQGTNHEKPTLQPSDKIITMQDIGEIERLEQQVRQNEKLAAIGMMSASIAHDFRNPLTAISGSAQILANELSSKGANNHANFELVEIILRESGRMADTIAEFLTFSRPEQANCSWFSLRNCLDEVLEVLRADPIWPETSQISFDFDGTIDIWADERQIFIILSHLIQNGLAFCPAGNEQITIQAEEIRDTTGRDSIELLIIDNGPGVDIDKREQIFEPFFTGRTDGTGLGLAIVDQAIKEHHGTIFVDRDEVGGGAVFTISLPLPTT